MYTIAGANFSSFRLYALRRLNNVLCVGHIIRWKICFAPLCAKTTTTMTLANQKMTNKIIRENKYLFYFQLLCDAELAQCAMFQKWKIKKKSPEQKAERINWWQFWFGLSYIRIVLAPPIPSIPFLHISFASCSLARLLHFLCKLHFKWKCFHD